MNANLLEWLIADQLLVECSLVAGDQAIVAGALLEPWMGCPESKQAALDQIRAAEQLEIRAKQVDAEMLEARGLVGTRVTIGRARLTAERDAQTVGQLGKR